MKEIVIDSGPLIALFDSSDSYHNASIEFIKKNKDTLISTLAVITEVAYVLDFNVNAQLDFLQWVHLGGLQVINASNRDIGRIKELMEKYKDRPMDFADGSIVAICERMGISLIASVDTDFDIYRMKHNKKFQNLFLKNKG